MTCCEYADNFIERLDEITATGTLQTHNVTIKNNKIQNIYKIKYEGDEEYGWIPYVEMNENNEIIMINKKKYMIDYLIIDVKINVVYIITDNNTIQVNITHYFRNPYVIKIVGKIDGNVEQYKVKYSFMNKHTHKTIFIEFDIQ